MLSRIPVASFGVVAVVLSALLAGAVPWPVNDAAVESSRSDNSHDRRSTSLDTASSAIPTGSNVSVKDSAEDTVRTRTEGQKAVASSIATSNCAGCDGQSTVFQVVYFDGTGGVAADNSAAAWSSCAGCSSSAVSVQLVVARHAQLVTVNNRALALNVSCERCTTTAAAIQFVISGGTRRDLSAQARKLISQIQELLADRLANSAQPDARRLTAPEAKKLADESASKLEQIILSDVGAASVQRTIDVQVGQ